jgi:hypothetical protein
MSFLVPKIPQMPKPETMPQPDDEAVKHAQLQEYAAQQARGANAYTNRMGHTGGSFGARLGDYGSADTAGGSSILRG